jgi:quinol monooxygenase YgiN
MSETRLTFIVHLPGRPEQREQLEACVRGVLIAMSAEPDFVHCTLHRSQDAPDTLVVYETWRCSRADFLANHLGKPYRQVFEQTLPDMLAAPRRIEFLDDVDPSLSLGAARA